MTINSPLSVIRSVIPSLEGVRILDIGCGAGRLAKSLAAEGARVTGIDPNWEAVLKARDLVPTASFERARVEALPFNDGTFDVVVVVNTLHHVPVDAMDLSLAEAARVTSSSGFLIVIEPLAEGPSFEALRIVEDETAVRLAAQQALARAVAGNLLSLENTICYVRRDVFDDVAQFHDRVIAVDPARTFIVQSKRETIVAAVLAAAAKDHQGRLILDQPIKADLFRVIRS